MKKIHPLLEAGGLIVALQAARIGLEKLVAPLLPDTVFAKRMTTMAVMILLAVAVVLYAKMRKTPLSVFPARFSRWYIIATCVAAVLLVTTPSNFTGGITAIMLLFYGSVVTPVFEELVFRGYIWNRLAESFKSGLALWGWNVALFTVWHLGYMLPQLFAGNWTAVLWKLAAGVGYGAVLGFVRLKTNNCFSCMLVHGVLNIFMI